MSNCQKTCEPLIPADRIDAYVDHYHDLHSEDDTSLTLDSSFSGKKEVSLLPMMQAGETNTEMHGNDQKEQIEYFSERHYTRDNFPPYCVTGKQIASWINLTDLKDVDIPKPNKGDVVYWDGTKWVGFNLDNALAEINQKISLLIQRVTNVENRLADIESLIYNYPQDKTTKIPRGNINHFSGDPASRIGILSHDGEADNDVWDE